MNLPEDKYSVFLKITQKNNEHTIIELEQVLKMYSFRLRDAGPMKPAQKKKARIFGVLGRINIPGVTGIEYELLGMDPFCIETGQPKNTTLYRTVNNTIQAAIHYFDKKGYVAKPIALKEFLDSV